MVLAEFFTANGMVELWVHIPILVVRTLITFFTVLVVVRWTGKRSIANLAPFDMAMVIMIGEVAAIPVSELRVDLLHGILPVFLIGGLHVLMTTLSVRSKAFERFTEGKPTLLVKNGKVLHKNLRRERVSMDDLMTALRHKEVTRVSEVREAWIEHAGGVSVIRTDDDRLTPQALTETMEDLLQQAIDRIAQANAAQMKVELAALVRRLAESEGAVRGGAGAGPAAGPAAGPEAGPKGSRSRLAAPCRIAS